MVIKTINKYSFELLKYLNLQDKNYSLEEIKKALLLKNIDSQLDNKHYILLNSEGNKLFEIKDIKIRLSILLSIIHSRFLITYNKPKFDYYEYKQIPVYVNKLRIIN
jgi:hypothetical protein